MQVDKIRGPQTDQLIDAILALKDREEAYRFFDDLATISEIQSLSQRFEVARMLRLKKTYEHIKNETGASTATISRVRRCLNYGNDAYDEMLGRLYPDEKPFQLPKE
ncbi:YerC/YecD family TrpR-related protein [Planococcus beigongshangi]|uniref:YerC/YecD family TrpR-related protein n=1 Tax=Planococcus beigongshangi TaxID=2782536 RepID=UPI00193BBDB0|nr:YerC/YecD family TrpR-related protein [Planococcus beigongshangi]